ncbi:TPA: hypothetical protein N0F65_000403 [Lagenidium giganteum]|uniref:Uncharacterized protein n=1 Tax=Lagenidium giganteum TaxID=4803 RepID=A0AAV2Z0E5_9STRA|nr:TPA: hypothetical protein N0F65_000403 [Lagenidium giganteum]
MADRWTHISPSGSLVHGNGTDTASGGLTWEDWVVSAEIAAAIALSLWLMQRKKAYDVMILGGASPTFEALSPLVQVDRALSLQSLYWYRVGVCVFYALVQLYDVFRTEGLCFFFYTTWNFIAQGTYFVCAARYTLRLLQQHERHSSGDHAPSMVADETVSFLPPVDGLDGLVRRGGSRRRSWLRLDLILDVCLATSLLIGIVVWTILYPWAVRMHDPEKLLNWVSYCQHGINILLLQLDFSCTQHQVSPDALALLIAWPTTYCIFTWIVHGTIKRGFWPYPFLKLDTPTAPIWYAGLLLAHLACFAIVYLCSRLKRSCRQRTPRADAPLVSDHTSEPLLSPPPSSGFASFDA